MTSKRVTLVGKLDSFTGYGQHLLQTFKFLEGKGHHVSIRAISISQPFGSKIPINALTHVVYGPQPEPWELIIDGPNWTVPTLGKQTIYFSMWESTKLPKRGVDILNRADGIIVPCAWCANAFLKSGIKRPIRVVPLGFDPSVFRPSPVRMQGPCVFATAGRLSHGGVRKGVNEVIAEFRRAFINTPDVRLHVKVHPDCAVQHTDDPRIRILREHLTDEATAEWLSQCTAFVSGATCEAWGLWQLQAMACGRPVVAAIYAGLAEFMTKHNSYPVDFKIGPAEDIYKGHGNWAHPDFNNLGEQMRRIYLDREEAVDIGFQAAMDVARFTWQNSGERLYKLLQSAGMLT